MPPPQTDPSTQSPASQVGVSAEVCVSTSATAASSSVTMECPWSKYETALPPHSAQSTIDGRNGSNACTVISSVFIRNCLEAATADGAIDIDAKAMCDAMREGNDRYDKLRTHLLLLADEVIDIKPSVGVNMCAESFVRPTDLDTMVTLMCTTSQNVSNSAYGGIFVITPYSFSLLSYQDRFILFDSHGHEGTGALLANVPSDKAAAYLVHFFAKYYSRLQFNASATHHPAAHMTFLALREDDDMEC